MGELSQLPNIGKVVEEKLQRVGISTQKDLQAVGSKEAFLRLRGEDPGACINMLCALEGAIQGIRWHGLPDEKKQELKMFYQSLR